MDNTKRFYPDTEVGMTRREKGVIIEWSTL